MGILDGARKAIRNFLEIREPSGLSVTVDQVYTHDAEVFRNRLWYRGQAEELSDFYEQIDKEAGRKCFWSARPTAGANIRKIHTGLPALIVDTLADVSVDDLDAIECERQFDWDEIADDNNFKQLVRDAVGDVLWSGDGAWKWSIDTEISQYPIIEFFDASRVDYDIERGRLVAVIFKTKKEFRGKEYVLKERYSKDDITYKLCNADGKEVDMSAFEETAQLVPVKIEGGFMMALPMMFRHDKKHAGRGKSVFDGKIDAFDSFDEVWSQWMLALRKGQIKTYIPDALLPRDMQTGMILRRNEFDNDFVATASDMREGSENKITHTQGEIQHEALVQTYCTALDLCLQGILSPSTLGIDVKKMDNAEAQREKEKTTLYRRDQIVNTLEELIPQIVNISLKVYDAMHGEAKPEQEVSVTFGGYANPSFEAQIETVAKASAAGIMSIEAQVEELWGDSRDDDWKKEEVKRIKEERGEVTMEEPAVNAEIGGVMDGIAEA